MKEILIREELKNRIIETSDKLLKDKINLSMDKLNNLYNLFKEKFGINKLKSLDGEELIKLFSLGNKDGLFYWLEFKNDEEFNTRSFGSIAGGSAFKYILFNRNKDNKWITGNPQNPKILNDDEVLFMIREIRDLLIKGSEIIKEEIEKEISLNSYNRIQNRLLNELKYNMGNLGWVHKYYHMMYPEYIDDFHSEYMKKYFLTCCGVDLNGNEKRYDMAGYVYFISKEVELPFNYLTSSMANIFGSVKEYISIKCSDNENIEKMKVSSYINIEEKLSENLEADLNKINKLKKNDIIVLEKDNKILGIAKYSGNYEYIEDSEYPHTLYVEWIKIYDESNDLRLNEKKTNGAVYFIKYLKNMMIIEEEIFKNTNKKNYYNSNYFIDEIDALLNIKTNKEFAFKTIEMLNKYNCLTEENINNLKN
ncbi:hypothetical protein R0131_10005, partial [Clostridium sp. AL.422]|nr:hypothetical protein [Clostridium sp. AL.422]